VCSWNVSWLALGPFVETGDAGLDASELITEGLEAFGDFEKAGVQFVSECIKGLVELGTSDQIVGRRGRNRSSCLRLVAKKELLNNERHGSESSSGQKPVFD
jgi:hypothetical protein